METICLQCGDAGWDNAFVDCVQCLKFSVHRYCLDKTPETFDEFVDWKCDDCKGETQKESGSREQNCETLGKKKSSEDVPLKNLVKNKKKKRRFEELGNEKEHRTRGCNSSAKQSHKKRKNVDSHDRSLISPTKKQSFNVGDERRVSGKSHESDKDKRRRQDRVSLCNSSADGSKKRIDTALPLQDDLGLDLDIQCNKVSDKVIRSDIYEDGDENITTTEVQAEFATSPTVNHGEDSLEDSEDGNAQPLAIPIWSGGFRITNKDRSLNELVAHLSNRACEMVYSTAREFQRVIHFEMHPKAQVWPKSFETVEPSGESIALYFFASGTRSANVFDQLVKDMISEKLALKAVLGDAELLIFTSIELPLRYWRFLGKFYLWGVFRGKRRTPPDSGLDGRAIELHKALKSPDMPKDADGDGSNRRKSSSKSKGCTKAQSPLSTLSNSASCGTEEV